MSFDFRVVRVCKKHPAWDDEDYFRVSIGSMAVLEHALNLACVDMNQIIIEIGPEDLWKNGDAATERRVPLSHAFRYSEFHYFPRSLVEEMVEKLSRLDMRAFLSCEVPASQLMERCAASMRALGLHLEARGFNGGRPGLSDVQLIRDFVTFCQHAVEFAEDTPFGEVVRVG